MKPLASNKNAQSPGSKCSFGRSRFCKRPTGFTFVEILAAMFFLAILVPAILEGITLSSRIAVITERGAIATELAQNKLAELTLNNAWLSADASGDFGEDWQGYRWEVTQSTWDMDAMTLLAVKVYFTVQGMERNVTLSTLVNSSTTDITTSSSNATSTSTQAQ